LGAAPTPTVALRRLGTLKALILLPFVVVFHLVGCVLINLMTAWTAIDYGLLGFRRWVGWRGV
jgi:hypothetical protein